MDSGAKGRGQVKPADGHYQSRDKDGTNKQELADDDF
tara:strand:- start:147 stop:257 length:111 start_codon:yes stop_codon:yes gene_type:complete